MVEILDNPTDFLFVDVKVPGRTTLKKKTTLTWPVSGGANPTE